MKYLFIISTALLLLSCDRPGKEAQEKVIPVHYTSEEMPSEPKVYEIIVSGNNYTGPVSVGKMILPDSIIKYEITGDTMEAIAVLIEEINRCYKNKN